MKSPTPFETSSLPHGIQAPEQINRIPVRPLGELSDFAAEELPRAIQTVRDGAMPVEEFARQVDAFAQTAGSSLELDERSVPLALHDATSIASALRVLKSEATFLPEAADTPFLQELTRNLARMRGVIPYLSYEGLMFANPIDTDPRTFLAGELGAQELLFYKLHVLIEQECCTRLSAPLSIVENYAAKQDVSRDQLLSSLNALQVLLQHISSYMRQFHQYISKEHNGAFATARPFWNADGKFQGPSGKFSAGFFLIDAILSGNDPAMRAFLKTKLHELPYYANTRLHLDGFIGQDDMLSAFSAIERGCDLKKIALKTGDQEVQSVLAKVLKDAEINRSIHIGLASGFLPEAFKNGASGTGEQGMSMKAYLAQAHGAYQNALSSLPQ